MTAKAYNDLISVDKWTQFHEILCATGGRYISNPYATKDGIRVSYEFGDMVEHQCRWRMITQPVKEVRKDQWFRKLFRRMCFKF